MNGAQSLFKSLVDAGITTCFANPGTSEMQLVYEIGMADEVRPVLCLQEDVVTGAADGYGRMKGTPAFTLLHVASGFANGIAMLHNAGRANTPVVNVVGSNASYHQPNYPEHELINGRVTDLARAVSHWCHEARSASHLGELGAEAAALAKTGKKTGLVLGNLALQAEALEIAARVAAKSGAALLAETFPSRHLSRGEGRPPVDLIPYEYEISIKFLEPFEQLIFVGASFPVATFAYKNKPTFKSPPGCDLFAMASAGQDLEMALKSLAEATGAAGVSTPRQPRTAAAQPSGELTAKAIGQTLCTLLPDDAILVDEAATNGPPIFEATTGARAHDYLNPVNGGAIGGGLPMALGAAIACPDRKVVHFQADGSGMYTVQALWSMAREKADVIIIVLKNDAYAILNLEMARVREREMNAKMKSMLDLGNPSLDWVNIATGLGVPATRAGTAEEFHQRFEAALAANGPRLIECQVAIPKEWFALEEYIHRTR
jgi:acetolactate synthase-1/2/3 large subunit